MASLKCRQCGEIYSSCSDALAGKDYKSFCCSEECYQAYIKVVLENRMKLQEEKKEEKVMDKVETVKAEETKSENKSFFKNNKRK